MIKLRVPGSKSITNRALITAALAGGRSKLKNCLNSDDTMYMQMALKALGCKITGHGSDLIVHGCGGNFQKPSRTLFCGNAGTAMRFLAAVLAGQPFASVLTGDKRMQKRPIKDLLDALRQLGAKVQANNGCPPVKIRENFIGGTCHVKGNISSQFISGLLLAAPLAKKDVTIKVKGNLVSKPYVDMTISVMRDFGIDIRQKDYKEFHIKAGQKYKPRTFTIEGDASSAGYFWGLSALTGERIEMEGVPEKSIQADARFKEIIKKMIGDKTGFLKPIGRINCSNFPDSAMTLAVLCAFAKGKSVLTGLSNLRVKECDRLCALTAELNKIGCETKELKDGLEIHGDPESLHGAIIKTYSDHRMAMCFGIAGVCVPDIKIENPTCVSKTYPGFWKDLNKVKKYLAAKNIVLTGMRGSGKTEIGRILAKKLKRKFIDLDELIEKLAGEKIAEIVRSRGWKYFRELEHKAARKLAKVKNAVISTGGGTLMHKRNVKILKKNDKIIFLHCPVKILKKRIENKKNRPSLTGKTDFLSELATVYKKRIKTYFSVADAVMDVSADTLNKKRDLKSKAGEILKIARRFGI